MATERTPPTAERTPPSRPSKPPSFDEAEIHRRRVRELETQLEEQKRVTEEPSPAKPGSKEARCAHTISPDCPAYPPSREVLLARARCGTVLVDTPAFLGEENEKNRPPPVTPEQEAAYKLAREFKAELFQEMESIHRELAGPAYKPSRTFTRLRTRAAALAKEGSFEIQRTISEELAGLRAPPTPELVRTRPPVERFWRLLFGIGDRYERRAAEVFGLDAVRAKREDIGGWAQQTLYVGKCPD